jgi:hypothetical protein
VNATVEVGDAALERLDQVDDRCLGTDYVQEIRKLKGIVRADALLGTPDVIAIVEGDDLAAMDAMWPRCRGWARCRARGLSRG